MTEAAIMECPKIEMHAMSEVDEVADEARRKPLGPAWYLSALRKSGDHVFVPYDNPPHAQRLRGKYYSMARRLGIEITIKTFVGVTPQCDTQPLLRIERE